MTYVGRIIWIFGVIIAELCSQQEMILHLYKPIVLCLIYPLSSDQDLICKTWSISLFVNLHYILGIRDYTLDVPLV